jgi:ADP-ribose pyrophosphatase
MSSGHENGGNGVWKIVSSNLVLDRSPWIRVWDEHVVLPNGAEIEGYIRTESRSFSMCFALTTDGLVPVTRQYKHGVGKKFYELPAGYLEEGESPLECAKRELLEETGLGKGRWEHLASLVLNSNRGNAMAHMFIAIGVERVSEPCLDETEVLEVEYFTPQELQRMIWDGRLESMATVANILLACSWMNSR